MDIEKMFEGYDLPEIIKQTRRINYLIQEGFFETKFDSSQLSDHHADILFETAEQLAELAGVSVEVAASAILNIAIKEYLGLEDGK